MKRTILITLAALCCFSIFAQDKRKAAYAAVAFYNLENLFDTIANNPLGRDAEFTPDGARQWNGQKYWSKIHNMAYAISQFTTPATPVGPAVIGVSEIENRSVLEDLVADPQIAKWNLQICHHDSPDRRGVDVGMLYNPKYFFLENITNHTLDIGYPTRDQMCVVGKLLGQPMAFIINHWPSRLGGEEKSSPNREAAAALCKHIADSLWAVNPEIGVVIMGDLNDDPQNKSCRVVLGAKKDRKKVSEHEFYNPFWKKLDDGIGTLGYKGSWNLFDQIILSGNIANGGEYVWHFFRADVLNKDFLIDDEGTRQCYPKRTFSAGVFLNGFSDHFPTQVILQRFIPAKD